LQPVQEFVHRIGVRLARQIWQLIAGSTVGADEGGNEDILVTFAVPAAFILVALGATGFVGDPMTTPDRMQFAQVVVRQQIIIRTMRVQTAPAQNATPVDWKEVRSVNCVQASAISGAAQLGQRNVDLVLRNGTRVRARLGSSCPALDYYYGFYITPGQDGLVCKDREAIRSRAGGQCEIDAFQLLQAVPRRPPQQENAATPSR
jgi:hypothetical protein